MRQTYKHLSIPPLPSSIYNYHNNHFQLVFFIQIISKLNNFFYTLKIFLEIFISNLYFQFLFSELLTKSYFSKYFEKRITKLN